MDSRPVPGHFGPNLPEISEWTRQHYEFSGYVSGFDPPEHHAARDALGYLRQAEDGACLSRPRRSVPQEQPASTVGRAIGDQCVDARAGR